MSYQHDLLHTEPDHLIAYWPMDDGAGQTLREMTGRAAPAAGAGLIWDSNGCYFDGTNSWAAIYSAALAANFSSLHGSFVVSFSFAVGVTHGDAPTMLCLGKDSTHYIFGLYNIATHYLVGRWRGTNIGEIQYPWTPDGLWHTLAFSWDATQAKVRLYIDGHPQTPLDFSSFTTWTLASGYANIGAFWLPNGKMKGYIRDVAIWDIMLTDQQMRTVGENPVATSIGQLQIAYKDYDGERSTFHLDCAVLSAANFDAQAALRDALVAAIDAVVLGERQEYEYRNLVTQDVGAPDDPTAQRELAWEVQYHDATSLKNYAARIPTPDLDQLDPNDRANAAIGDAGVVDNFVSKFEAYALTKDGHAPVTDEIKLVGRNL